MFNLKFLVDLIFPVECLGCDKPGEWLCASCFKEIKINDSEENPKLRQNDFLTGVLVCSDYNQEVLAKALRYYKYNFVVDLSEPLSKLLINFLRFKTGEGKTIDFDLVAPVPLSRKRKMWRGFNQSEILARAVSGKFNLEFCPDLISRKHQAQPQVGLKALDRLNNVKAVFKANKNYSLAGKKILLIDDVITTGATIDECAKVLKEARAREVWALVIAKD